MHGVRLEAVRKAHGLLVILDELNLQLEDGEFLVLLGPSGCGKSTLHSATSTPDCSSGEKVERNAPLPIHIDGGRVSLFPPDSGVRLA
jgi:ABC-type nitrate/sulfonate/bicarbonate transport system ATPase subunit